MRIRVVDLSERKICLILSKSFREKLFLTCKQKFGSYEKITKYISKCIRKRLERNSVSRWKKENKAVPLFVVKELIKIYNSISIIKIETNELERNVIALSVKKSIFGGSGKYLYNPKFPIKWNPQLANLIGHMIADGSAKKSNMFTYANKRKELINEVLHDIWSTFGNVDCAVARENRKYKQDLHERLYKIYIVRIPAIIGVIIKKFCKKFGSKTAVVPKVIWTSNIETKSSFLRALFDDEGSVYIKEKKIKIKLANKKLIKQIKKLLKQLSIESGKIQKDKKSYLINICGFRDLKTFSELIGFTHKIKRKKLDLLLNSYKHLAWTRK